MKDNVQAIIYDWDDVILNVAHGYFQLLQETAGKLGSKPFTFVFTDEDIVYPKPDPRAFNLVKKKLADSSITPDEALYVGDSLLDFQSASGAGLQFVGVLTGITEKVKFVNCGVSSSMIIPSVAELPELLKSGLNG